MFLCFCLGCVLFSLPFCALFSFPLVSSQVAISPALRREIEKGLGNPFATMFESAQREAYKLLCVDFSEFLGSRVCESYLAERKADRVQVKQSSMHVFRHVEAD